MPSGDEKAPVPSKDPAPLKMPVPVQVAAKGPGVHRHEVKVLAGTYFPPRFTCGFSPLLKVKTFGAFGLGLKTGGMPPTPPAWGMGPAAAARPGVATGPPRTGSAGTWAKQTCSKRAASLVDAQRVDSARLLCRGEAHLNQKPAEGSEGLQSHLEITQEENPLDAVPGLFSDTVCEYEADRAAAGEEIWSAAAFRPPCQA